MMLNEAMFAGYQGWVLKPPGYRSASKAEQQNGAATQGTLDLSIEFFAGQVSFCKRDLQESGLIRKQDIPLPIEHEESKPLKPLVKLELHVEPPVEFQMEHQGRHHAVPAPGSGMNKDGEYKLRTKTSKTQHPDFKREVLAFRKVTNVVPELSFVR